MARGARSLTVWSVLAELKLDTWHHVALERYGESVVLFVDGQTAGLAADAAGDFGFPNAADTPLLLGAYAPAAEANRHLTGALDELRITRGLARWRDGGFAPPLAASASCE